MWLILCVTITLVHNPDRFSGDVGKRPYSNPHIHHMSANAISMSSNIGGGPSFIPKYSSLHCDIAYCQGITVTTVTTNDIHQITITWLLSTATCLQSSRALYQRTPPKPSLSGLKHSLCLLTWLTYLCLPPSCSRVPISVLHWSPPFLCSTISMLIGSHCIPWKRKKDLLCSDKIPLNIAIPYALTWTLHLASLPCHRSINLLLFALTLQCTRQQGAPNTGPWYKNQGFLHMFKACRHRRVTLIMRSRFPLGENPLVLSHHCRGLMYSRPIGIMSLHRVRIPHHTQISGSLSRRKHTFLGFQS